MNSNRAMMGYPNGATNVAPDALPGAVRYVFAHGNGTNGYLDVLTAAADERFVVRALRVCTAEVFQSLVGIKLAAAAPNDGDECDQLCGGYVWDQTYEAVYTCRVHGGGAGLTVEPSTTLWIGSSLFANPGFFSDSVVDWRVFAVFEDISRTL